MGTRREGEDQTTVIRIVNWERQGEGELSVHVGLDQDCSSSLRRERSQRTLLALEEALILGRRGW